MGVVESALSGMDRTCCSSPDGDRDWDLKLRGTEAMQRQEGRTLTLTPAS